MFSSSGSLFFIIFDNLRFKFDGRLAVLLAGVVFLLCGQGQSTQARSVFGGQRASSSSAAPNTAPAAPRKGGSTLKGKVCLYRYWPPLTSRARRRL